MNSYGHEGMNLPPELRDIYRKAILAFFSLVEAYGEEVFTPKILGEIASEVDMFVNGRSKHENSYQRNRTSLTERLSDGICSYFQKSKAHPLKDEPALYSEFLEAQNAKHSEDLRQRILPRLETQEGVRSLITETFHISVSNR